jgi:hypothetical protein
LTEKLTSAIEAQQEAAQERSREIQAESAELIRDLISLYEIAQIKTTQAVELISENREMKNIFYINESINNSDVINTFVVLSELVKNSLWTIKHRHP